MDFLSFPQKMPPSRTKLQERFPSKLEAPLKVENNPALVTSMLRATLVSIVMMRKEFSRKALSKLT